MSSVADEFTVSSEELKLIEISTCKKGQEAIDQFVIDCLMYMKTPQEEIQKMVESEKE